MDTTTGAIEATQTKTLQLDNTPPRVAFGTPPTGSPYPLNQRVAASYSCIDRVDGMDGGVGVATCDGPVPNGGNLVTNPVGAHTFTVNTADQLGNANPGNVWLYGPGGAPGAATCTSWTPRRWPAAPTSSTSPSRETRCRTPFILK